MKIDERKTLVLVLVLFSAYLTAYTIMAHLVCSRHITEISGKAYWETPPKGSLFPWPIKKTEEIVVPVLIPLEGVDLFIYQYLVKTYLLTVICILLWISTLAVLYKS